MRHLAPIGRVLVAAACLAAWGAAILNGQQPVTPERLLTLNKGLLMALPPGWQQSEAKYRDVMEVVVREPSPTQPGADLESRMMVMAEPRSSYADALARLEAIAAEVPSAPPELMMVSGWPALQRRYAVPLEQRGQEEPALAGEPSVGEPPMSSRVTVAVAAGETLVRMDAAFAPGASAKRIEEAEAMGRSLRAPAPSAAEKARGESFVRDMSMRLHANPAPTPAPSSPPTAALDEEIAAPAELADEAGAGATVALTAATGAGVLVPGQSGELEVAVSNNGQNVVVATNGGFAVSANGGQTFVDRGALPTPFPRDGDPSLAVGRSGNFYLAFIGFPPNGCSTGIASSTDNGQNFNFVANATLCPNGNAACFPDQEHIAADRVNAAAAGDQVYSVWRNFAPITPGPNVNCRGIGTGFVTPSLVCSSNGGNAWGATVALATTGDFPRVAAGRDGSVYVVFRQNSNVVLDRFSSCASGLVRQTGFPVTVATVTDVACAVSGLDRCNNGNVLSSQTVAADDLSAPHVYVAFANRTVAGNEEVRVFESTNFGRTFPRSVRVNAAATGRRFMPWVCASGGVAFASWYDRRAASRLLPTDPACTQDCREARTDCLEDFPPRLCLPAFNRCVDRCERRTDNDLTEYFFGMALPGAGTLVAATDVNLSGRPDPQCASGWPCAPRNRNDAESCSVQPQVAGVCCNATQPNCPGSQQRCDFSSTVCPAGETCNGGGGCPKYGDYNGNACVGGRAFFAWASATTPTGAPAGNGLRVFHATTAPGATLTVRKLLSPANDPGRFNLTIDGVPVAGPVGHQFTTGPLGLPPGTHSVGEVAAVGTSSINYNLTFSGDCAPAGRVTLASGDAKTCILTNMRVPRAECLALCEELREDCLSTVGEPGGPLASQCNTFAGQCRARCG